MKKTRNDIFETNSSSTHVIVVEPRKNDKRPIKVSPAWCGEFGWEWDKWYSIEDKLAYMVRCLVCYDYDENTLEERINPIQERLHNLGIDFEIPTYEEYKNGYVDHEDWYQEEIKDIYDDDEELLDFLLGENSCIIGGNDND